MNIKEYLDILKDLWTPTNASKIRMSISNALEMMGNNLKENIDRQDNVENQFQDVLDETTGKDVINGPEIIAARNGEANLKARLDKEKNEVTAQLAQKAEQTEVEQLSINKADKITVDAINNIKVDKDGNEQVSWGMLDQTVKENITGGNTPVVGLNSVNTSNIVDGATTLSKRTPLGGYALIYCSSGYPNFDFNTNKLTIPKNVRVSYGKKWYEVSTEDVVVSLRTETQYGIIMFNTKTLEFIDRTAMTLPLTSEDEVLIATYNGATKTVFMTGHYTINGVSLLETDSVTNDQRTPLGQFGVLYSSTKVPDFNFLTNVLTITRPRVVYKRKWVTVSDEEIKLSLNTHGFGYGIILLNTKTLTFTDNDWDGLRLASDDDILIAVYNVANQIVTMVGPHTINGQKDSNDDESFYLQGDFSSFYKSPDCQSMSSTLNSLQITDIYGEFDLLQSQHPDRISKNLLGYGSDVNGNEDSELPIYEYVVNAPTHTSIGEAPTVLIQCAIHGNEKSTTWSTLEFLKQALELENETLSSLIGNLNFKIIPVLNPGGFNDDTRNNRHGVNLNRNYDYRWNVISASDKGSSALSEVETTLSNNWINDNTNAIAFIDFHNTTTHPAYVTTPSKPVGVVYKSVSRRLTDWWRKRYSVSGNELLGELIPPWDNGWGAQSAYFNTGIERSFILESGIYSMVDSIRGNSEVIEKGVEILVNMLAGIVDEYMN